MQQDISYSPPLPPFSYTFDMDAVRELIVAKSKELKKSLRSLSLNIGKDHAYLHQFVHKGSPRKLPEDERRLLAHLISVDETELGAVCLCHHRICDGVRLCR